MMERHTSRPDRPRLGARWAWWRAASGSGKLHLPRSRWLLSAVVIAVALVMAACGSSSSSSGGSGGGTTGSGSVRVRTISGTKVLVNAQGHTLYSFAPDTRTTSKCNGACAQVWPPVPGPATHGSNVTGTVGTIKRNDGATQATYNGHPLYTYTADTAPGQDKGNGINLNGGVWHAVPVSGGAPPTSSPSGGGGGGY